MLATVGNRINQMLLAGTLGLCAALVAGCSESRPLAAQPADDPAATQLDTGADPLPGDVMVASAADESRPEARPTPDRAEAAAPKAPANSRDEIRVAPPAKPNKPAAYGHQHGQAASKSAKLASPAVGQSSPPSEQPRWTCEQTTAQIEPVWQGRPAVFAFVIGNSGSASLRIQAKGG